MSLRRFPSLLVLVFAGGLIAAPALAQMAALTEPVAYEEGGQNQHAHDIVQGPHVEGHIAFLHAELDITPAQEALWAKVAAAMREDVSNLQEAGSRVAGAGEESQTAIQYLENRVTFAKLRAQGEERFLKAFRPLYENLSDEQKRKADDLLMPRD